MSPDIVTSKDAFCFAVERRSMTRFATFPYCTRVLREEISASMTNKKIPESDDCGSVQVVPGLISTITSLATNKHLKLKCEFRTPLEHSSHFKSAWPAKIKMLGRVTVCAGRNISQATLSVRRARTFAHDEFCLHKNCTCHMRRCAPLQ